MNKTEIIKLASVIYHFRKRIYM